MLGSALTDTAWVAYDDGPPALCLWFRGLLGSVRVVGSIQRFCSLLRNSFLISVYTITIKEVYNILFLCRSRRITGLYPGIWPFLESRSGLLLGEGCGRTRVWLLRGLRAFLKYSHK